VSRASSKPPVLPQKIPYLGTSWQQRGAAYWLRRSWLTVWTLCYLAIVTSLIVAIYVGFASVLPTKVRLAWNIVQIAGSVFGLVWGLVRRRRQLRSTEPLTPAETWRREAEGRRRRVGGALSGPGLALIAAPVAPLLMAFFLGMVFANLSARELSAETGARLDYERRLGVRA
jgi:hypothetical protein